MHKLLNCACRGPLQNASDLLLLLGAASPDFAHSDHETDEQESETSAVYLFIRRPGTGRRKHYARRSAFDSGGFNKRCFAAAWLPAAGLRDMLYANKFIIVHVATALLRISRAGPTFAGHCWFLDDERLSSGTRAVQRTQSIGKPQMMDDSQAW